MNRRSQMQGGKNWILSKEIKCKPVLLRLSLAGNMEKPLMSLYGTEWRERGYGLSIHIKKIFKRGSPVSRSNSHETGEDGLFLTHRSGSQAFQKCCAFLRKYLRYVLKHIYILR
jgi:hypothetical protein